MAVISRQAPEKDHHLFVGVNLFVAHGGEMAPLRKMRRNLAVIERENGETVEVNRTTGFNWRMTPKVSTAEANIVDLDATRAHSPRNDPNRNWMGRQTNLMNYYADQVSAAEGLVATVDARAAAADASAANPYNTEPQPFEQSSEGIRQSTDAALMNATAAFDNMHSSDLFHGSRPEEEDQADYDAVRLTFKVSSPTPINDAYAVAISRIKLNGRFSDITYHHAIGRVDAQPRTIRVLQSGLPPGYEHVETRIYLFNHGKEIATNLSERRLDLTAVEAHQYLMLDHLAQNRNETVPARPVWDLAPNSLRAAENPDPFDMNVTVEIDADGTVSRVLAENRILPAAVSTTLENLVFLPALENGTPVPSQLSLNVADYFR